MEQDEEGEMERERRWQSKEIRRLEVRKTNEGEGR